MCRLVRSPICGPSAWHSSSSTDALAKGRTFSRRARPSFHSAVTASGASVPARTVATTNTCPCSTSWWMSAADQSSSRSASSTPSTIAFPPARAASRAAVFLSSSSGPAPDRGASASRCHSAPNGTTAADRVATTESVSRPVSAARRTASRASRVFPTPGPPTSTTPRAVPVDRAASITLSSAVRPVSGQSSPPSRSAVTPIPGTSTCGTRDYTPHLQHGRAVSIVHAEMSSGLLMLSRAPAHCPLGRFSHPAACGPITRPGGGLEYAITHDCRQCFRLAFARGPGTSGTGSEEGQQVNKRIPAAAASTVVLGLALGFGAGTASAAGTAGTLDPTFGHNGIVLTNLGLDANGNQIQAVPGAVALQSNGDIVVAVGIGGPDMGLVRYLPNDTRDTTFGNGGFAGFPDLGIGSTRPGLAVQSDGKLVWAGEATADNGTGAAFAVVRFNANGTLDQGFGTGGVATSAFANANVQGAQTVLVQPDGKILAGGAVLFGGRPPVDVGGLVRFNANGSIDKSFGSGGQKLVPNSNPVLVSVIGVTALGLDASGDIFTLPSHLEFSPAGQPTTLTPAAITTASPSTSGAVTFLPSGGFVVSTVVATCRGCERDVQLTRFNPDGSTAATATGIDYAGQNGALAVSDTPAAVAIQANGEAVVGGSHVENNQFSSTSVFGVARFNADATLDTAFGTGGVLTTRIQGHDSVILLVVQPDGKILAVGTSQNAAGVMELALARYLSQ